MAKKTVAAEVPAKRGTSDSEDAPKRAKISQADIPAYSLAEAIKVPRAIAENYGRKPTAPLKVAKGMNVQPNSSSFRMVTGAAMAYGLTKGGPNAPLIEITPLGLRVLKPTKEGDDLAAKREAILKPRVIGKFLTQYDNSPVPRRDIAINVLSTDMDVPEERAAAVFDMIMEGARAVGFVQKIKDKEYISLEGAGEAEEDESYDATEPIESLTEGTEAEPSISKIDHFPPAQSASDDTLAMATKRVFITHGKNKDFIDPIKKIITYGKYEAVVAEEKQSVSKPVPDKVMGSMRSCGAAIIHVDVEKVLKDEEDKEVQILNPNVLTEIGAAQALYGRRFILLVKDGVKLPSNLQGLYEVRYSGEKLDANDAFKLLDAMQDIQNHPIPDRYKE
ncbi:MAG TPA: TIR domain-containing protein [Terracidiphilus sp.]|nr:TIR domain-containing protein [Terracidiphilus sp.]